MRTLKENQSSLNKISFTKSMTRSFKVKINNHKRKFKSKKSKKTKQKITYLRVSKKK